MVCFFHSFPAAHLLPRCDSVICTLQESTRTLVVSDFYMRTSLESTQLPIYFECKKLKNFKKKNTVLAPRNEAARCRQRAQHRTAPLGERVQRGRGSRNRRSVYIVNEVNKEREGVRVVRES